MQSRFGYANNKAFLANVQYAGMTNYENRKSDVLLEWYAAQYQGQYDLNHYPEILEIGCGDGTFWKYVTQARPLQSHVVVTDMSDKMLADCRVNLTGVEINATYQTADIDALPFGPATFNAVLAHKVIYHAENPEQSIAGIAKVLKPEGMFGLSVLNSGVYQPIWKLAHSIDERIPDESLSQNFSNLEADAVLPKYFPSVESQTHISSKHFRSTDAVVKYVETNPLVQPLKLSGSFFTLFRAQVDDMIAAKGEIECDYNSNLYLCRKG